MHIREIIDTDIDGLFALYAQLHGNPIPEKWIGMNLSEERCGNGNTALRRHS